MGGENYGQFQQVDMTVNLTSM